MSGNDLGDKPVGGVNDDQVIKRIIDVKNRYEKELMSKANVVGVGVGFRQVKGQTTQEPALVVNVSFKVPFDLLSPDDLIPTQIEGIPVDVRVVGQIIAL